MKIHRVGIFALLLAVAPMRSAVAQDLRGPELRLNQLSEGGQFTADVAVVPNGDFIAVWVDSTIAGGREIKVRRFFADGRAKGGDLLVARLPGTPTSVSPHIAADAAGRFLVVWQGRPAASSGVHQAYGQRFDSMGKTLGPRVRFRASDFDQLNPDVAMTHDGRAVVVWQSITGRFDHEGARISDVYFRRLRANGAPAGPDVLALPSGEISRVAMRADGSFGIASEIYNFDPSFSDIYLSLFSANGGVLLEPFEVTSVLSEPTTQSDPAIAAAADGRMFVAWTDRAADYDFPGASDTDALGVAGQLIGADGSPLGENVRVNAYRKGIQERAAVAARPDGGFLIAWQTGGNQDGDGTGIFARHFAADGRRLGAEFRMNLGRQGNQSGVSLALTANGKGIAAWAGPDSAGNFEIFARRLAPPVR